MTPPLLTTARYDRFTIALVRHNYPDEGDCIFEQLHGEGGRMHSDSFYTLWRVGDGVLTVERFPEWLTLDARLGLLEMVRRALDVRAYA